MTPGSPAPGEQQAPAELVPAWVATLLADVAVIKSQLAPIADHETRLRALERRGWMLAGAAAAAGAGLGRLLDLMQV